jgi:hypothetical protein
VHARTARTMRREMVNLSKLSTLVGEHKLTCGVCLEPYDAATRRPLILGGCGHTYCEACVSRLPAPKTCPTCLKPVAVGLGSTTMGRGVAGLPTNWAILEVKIKGKRC